MKKQRKESSKQEHWNISSDNYCVEELCVILIFLFIYSLFQFLFNGNIQILLLEKQTDVIKKDSLQHALHFIKYPKMGYPHSEVFGDT